MKRAAALIALAAALLLTLGTGCASTPRSRLLELHASAWVFHRPAADVEQETRALLVANDFRLVPTDHDGVVRTEWKPITDDEIFATVYERYVVLIKRLTKEHCRIQAVKLSHTSVGLETYHPLTPFHNDGKGNNPNTAHYSSRGLEPLQMGKPTYVRDLGFEWRLLARVEPQRASRLQAVVDAQLGLSPR